MPKQTRETNIEGGEGTEATRVFIGRPNGAKFKLCFPETLINYDRD